MPPSVNHILQCISPFEVLNLFLYLIAAMFYLVAKPLHIIVSDALILIPVSANTGFIFQYFSDKTLKVRYHTLL